MALLPEANKYFTVSISNWERCPARIDRITYWRYFVTDTALPLTTRVSHPSPRAAFYCVISITRGEWSHNYIVGYFTDIRYWLLYIDGWFPCRVTFATSLKLFDSKVCKQITVPHRYKAVAGGAARVGAHYLS